MGTDKLIKPASHSSATAGSSRVFSHSDGWVETAWSHSSETHMVMLSICMKEIYIYQLAVINKETTTVNYRECKYNTTTF